MADLRQGYLKVLTHHDNIPDLHVILYGISQISEDPASYYSRK